MHVSSWVKDIDMLGYKHLQAFGRQGQMQYIKFENLGEYSKWHN